MIGNNEVKKYLESALAKGLIGNSYLFAGPEGIGKSLFAYDFALKALGATSAHHPDIHVYRPEGKVAMHSIDMMRRFNAEVYMAPFLAKRKAFIIHDADRMLVTSANALLKTFEEPALDALIILLTSAPQLMLPTIMSRCRKVYFKPVASTEIEEWLKTQTDPQTAHRLARKAKGSPANALKELKAANDPLSDAFIEIVRKAPSLSYKELNESVKKTAAYLDQFKKGLEEEATKEFQKIEKKEMTAQQREALEKEIDGAVSLGFHAEIDRLLNFILAWYRDVALLQAGGSIELLEHVDYEDLLRSWKGKTWPLDSVQQMLSQTKLAIQRFSSIESAYENLLLKLNYG